MEGVRVRCFQVMGGQSGVSGNAVLLKEQRITVEVAVYHVTKKLSTSGQ